MTQWLKRMKSGLWRMGDWISGHDVPVAEEPPPAELVRKRPTRRPAVDVYESQDELLLAADVPGSLPDTTQVHMSQGQLTILAQIPAPPDGPRLAGNDASTAWHVTFGVPDGVDPARAQASHRDGVLTLRLPKQARPAPHRIPVRTAS